MNKEFLLNPNKLQEVIDNFYNLYEDIRLKEDNIDMMQHRAKDCNTPLCFAGWFVIATEYNDINRDATYFDGKILINSKLNLKFDDWAELNPKIWGNKYGQFMFTSSDAWDQPSTVQDMINHLERVHIRLVKAYNKHNFIESLKFWKNNKNYITFEK